jgi:hypothetical protein
MHKSVLILRKLICVHVNLYAERGLIRVKGDQSESGKSRLVKTRKSMKISFRSIIENENYVEMVIN